jgi:AraC family transcriptional regulator, positive regulator of tynA and feaB
VLRVYDTSTQSTREQFDYWREELCHNFVELAPERFDLRETFVGRISQRDLDAITISRVTAEGHCVNRTKYEISRSSEDCFFANLQLAGRGRTRQGGVEIISKPGDLVLVDACKPYDIAHNEAFDLISVKVPNSLMENRLELRRSVFVPHIAAERGYGTVLRSYTMSILNELETEFIDSAPFLAENLVSLIASALNASEMNIGCAKLGYQQHTRLQAILGFINLNLSNPSLDLTTVSDRFSLSPRYVQKLFASTGSTFSRTVLCWRLDRVASCLRSSEYGGRTLTEIAFAWGFNDFSYFSRVFKIQFGITARDYRSQQALHHRAN